MAWTSYHDVSACCDRPDCSECRERAEGWIADHPAEAVAALIDAGVLEQVGWRYERVAPRSAPVRRYGLMPYSPAEAGHSDHERVYRVLTDNQETDADPVEAVRDVPVVIWFCPHRRDRGCRFVDWTTTAEGMTPRCVDCGEVGPLHPVTDNQEVTGG